MWNKIVHHSIFFGVFLTLCCCYFQAQATVEVIDASLLNVQTIIGNDIPESTGREHLKFYVESIKKTLNDLRKGNQGCDPHNELQRLIDSLDASRIKVRIELATYEFITDNIDKKNEFKIAIEDLDTSNLVHLLSIAQSMINRIPDKPNQLIADSQGRKMPEETVTAMRHENLWRIVNNMEPKRSKAGYKLPDWATPTCNKKTAPQDNQKPKTPALQGCPWPEVCIEGICHKWNHSFNIDNGPSGNTCPK